MPTLPESAVAPDASAKTRTLLADLWRRNRPVIEARLATLDLAAAADPLPSELQAEALDVAHKLSGSLGMFGFEAGTALARQIEVLLEAADPNRAKLAGLAKQLRAMLLPCS
jgi:HPt (histidine-containing phosphotransfer) domain-containing protein